MVRAHRYVMNCGFAVAAIDAPGHGDRLTKQDERFAADIRVGVPLAAAEPRITAAVFRPCGLRNAGRGSGPDHHSEFLLQWDDELVPRDSGLALFHTFASREKTLRANPGRHVGVPAFEMDSAARFFTRHLIAGEYPPASGGSGVGRQRYTAHLWQGSAIQ